jgi:T5orf172 domain
MTYGYVYVLTNRAMPGVVKIGRTERDPADRARELRTTGVPSPFELVHSSLVDDCEGVERQIHLLLAKRGVRHLPDREFFEISSAEAIELIETLSGQSKRSSFDFSRGSELSDLMASVSVPLGNELISEINALRLEDQLAKIGRQGYPQALKTIAEIFEVNYPSTLKFKEFWIEYLELARRESEARPVASGGRTMRAAVGRDAAEYLQRLSNRHGWLVPSDFAYISSFLVSGDRFVYEGYITEVNRPGFPTSVKEQAECL